MALGLKSLEAGSETEAASGPYVIVAYKTGDSDTHEDGTTEVWGQYDNAELVRVELERIEAGLPGEWSMVATPLKEAPAT